jgi:MFS superfamily sulfate permease-like transporter
MRSAIWIFTLFFVSALVAGFLIWLFVHIMGPLAAVTVVVAALLLALGAAIIEYITEER